MNDPLDQRLRQDLADSVPASVQERVRPHFAHLADRIRSSSQPHSIARPNRRAWWWSVAGALSAAVFAALLVVSWPTRLQAEVQFVGVLAMDGSTRFYLSDTNDGTSSGWISLQDSFAGYTLTAYDPSGDILTLRRDGEEIQISLRNASFEIERIEIRGTLTFASATTEPLRIDRATLLMGQDNIIPLRDGARLRINPFVVAEGSDLPPGLHYQVAHETPDPEGIFQTVHSLHVVAIPGREFEMRIGGSPDNPELRFRFEPVD